MIPLSQGLCTCSSCCPEGTSFFPLFPVYSPLLPSQMEGHPGPGFLCHVPPSIATCASSRRCWHMNPTGCTVTGGTPALPTTVSSTQGDPSVLVYQCTPHGRCHLDNPLDNTEVLNQERDLLGPCGFLGICVLDRSLCQLLPGSLWDTIHQLASLLPGVVGPVCHYTHSE